MCHGEWITMTSAEPSATVRIELLGRFSCSVGGKPQRLPLACQRLLAFLALHDRPLMRTFVAGSLWLDINEQRATANLRSALCRLGRHAERFVVSDRTSLALDDSVGVDVRSLSSVAYELVDGQCHPNADHRGIDELRLLRNDLLPDWYDDWLVMERERLHQLRLNALDRLSSALLETGSPALAMDAAYLSIAGEPLRESAHRALITAQLAVGNRSEALRQYNRFRNLLSEAVGLEPSADFQRLVDDAVHSRR